MNAEVFALALGLLVGACVAIARWREHQWRRSPLGQAELALARARQRRARQRETLARGTRWLTLALVALVGVAFLVWALAAMGAQLVTAGAAPGRKGAGVSPL